MYPGHAFEDRARTARLRQLDLQDANLGHRSGADLAAERLGEQLVTEAEAEERHLPLGHRFANRGALRLQPRVGVVLPDIHRAAHRPERIVGAEVRDRLPFVELYRGPFDVIFAQKIPEHAGMFDRDVLEDENSRFGGGHGALPRRLRRGRMV